MELKTAAEMAKIAEDFYSSIDDNETIQNLIYEIETNAETGCRYIFYFNYISDRVMTVLLEKGYKVKIDYAVNQSPYIISW